VKTHRPLTTGVIAKAAGVAPRTVCRWIDSGELPGYKIPLSNDRRIEVANARAFLAKHGMTGAAARLEEYLAERGDV